MSTETFNQTDQIIPEGYGFVHYGVRVDSMEDGGYVANGHVEPRRFLAAVNRHARKDLGLVNAEDDKHADAKAWLADVKQVYALPMDEEARRRHGYDGWGFKECAADVPGALPLTRIFA